MNEFLRFFICILFASMLTLNSDGIIDDFIHIPKPQSCQNTHLRAPVLYLFLIGYPFMHVGFNVMLQGLTETFLSHASWPFLYVSKINIKVHPMILFITV